MCIQHEFLWQQPDLAAAAGDFGETAASMGTTESNKQVAAALTRLGEVQRKIKELHTEQASQDELMFGNTVDEYVRTIGSIKVRKQGKIETYADLTVSGFAINCYRQLVLQARSKLFAAEQAAESNVIKKREALEKARSQPGKAAKMGAIEKEVEEVR